MLHCDRDDFVLHASVCYCLRLHDRWRQLITFTLDAGGQQGQSNEYWACVGCPGLLAGWLVSMCRSVRTSQSLCMYGASGCRRYVYVYWKQVCSKHRFTTLKVRAYIGTASPQAHIIPDYLKHQGLWLVACLGACTGLSPLQKRQRPRCHAIGSQHQQRQGCSPRYRPNNSGHYSLGPAQQDKKNLQEGPGHMLNPRINHLWSMGGRKTNQGCMEILHNHGNMENRSISWTPGCTRQSQKMSKIRNTGTARRKHQTSPQSHVYNEAAQ